MSLRNQEMLFAVNGTLMGGLCLNANLLAVGSTFVAIAQTAPCYRLWNIGDCYPAMIRVPPQEIARDPHLGASITLELWHISAEGLVTVLGQEPPGLTIGTILLDSGSFVFGVLGEPWICEGQAEITHYGGWRAYLAALAQPT